MKESTLSTGFTPANRTWVGMTRGQHLQTTDAQGAGPQVSNHRRKGIRPTLDVDFVVQLVAGKGGDDHLAARGTVAHST